MAGTLFSPNQATGITGGLDIIGLGGSIFGTMETASGAKQKAAAEQQIARLEMQADQVRREAMEMSARRQQLQTVRTAQQAKAAALATSVGQGAQFSSSAQAGQGQIGAQAAYANQGVSLSLQSGEKLFDVNQQIDTQKILESQAETKMAEGQGLSSLFGAVGKSAGGIGQLLTLIPAL